MKNIIVRRSVVEDVAYIARHMRLSDKREIYASHHLKPKLALQLGFEKSVYCMTVENGDPIIMFGVCPAFFFDTAAKVWMLSTDNIKKINISFIRDCKHYIDEMLNVYPALYNYVDIRNKVSIRWLTFLGAQFDAPAPYGEDGLEFRRFTIDCNKRNDCVNNLEYVTTFENMRRAAKNGLLDGRRKKEVQNL